MRNIRWDFDEQGYPGRVPTVHFSAGWDSPVHYPHYSDEHFSRGQTHTLYGTEEKGLSYVYSDRLWQWDYSKAEIASETATGEGLTVRSPHWYQVYLSTYFGKPVRLPHIIGGVNVSSGYEYYVFGYREAQAPESPSIEES